MFRRRTTAGFSFVLHRAPGASSRPPLCLAPRKRDNYLFAGPRGRQKTPTYPLRRCRWWTCDFQRPIASLPNRDELEAARSFPFKTQLASLTHQALGSEMRADEGEYQAVNRCRKSMQDVFISYVFRSFIHTNWPDPLLFRHLLPS